MNFTVTPFEDGFTLTHKEAGNPTKYFDTQEQVLSYINELKQGIQTIYFRSAIGSTIRVDCPTIEEGQHYWDKLSASGFQMVSTRP
jgi:hypothetical protein